MTKKSKLGRFLSHDITSMVISVLIAFGIWFSVNATSQTDTNVMISDIPVTIELPQEAIDDGLQVFTESEVKASVEVSGNRITVGSLSQADVQIVALQSNAIITPGEYTLELSAKKVGVKTNYNFVSGVSPSYINVFVDRLKEKTLDITDEIVYSVDEGYYAASSLSETSVTISGPETEVSVVEKAVIQGTMDGKAGETETSKKDIVFLDKDGNIVDVKMSTLSVTSVDVSTTALPTKEVSLKVDVVDAPAQYPPIIITPNKVTIAAEQSVLDDIKDDVVVIGTLDFSNLVNKKNSLTYDITLPSGCKNLSNNTSTKVEIDLSDYKTKTLTVDNFTTDNLDASDFDVVFNSKSIEVTVCGPSEQIDDITSADIVPYVTYTGDVSEISSRVSIELPFSFKMTQGFKSCWVYGDYTGVVSISKK